MANCRDCGVDLFDMLERLARMEGQRDLYRKVLDAIRPECYEGFYVAEMIDKAIAKAKDLDNENGLK